MLRSLLGAEPSKRKTPAAAAAADDDDAASDLDGGPSGSMKRYDGDSIKG